MVFEKNAETGLAVASTQKVLTSVAAYELLGKNYTYKTELRYTGVIKGNELNGDLLLIGFGDPTLGSSRFSQLKEGGFIKAVIAKLKELGIKKINGSIIADNSRFSTEAIPDGWIWEDIGNYYAAGHWALNWKENSFDLFIKAGDKPGDAVELLNKPPIGDITLKNTLQTGPKGSGDNAFIHLAPDATQGYVTGTIPAGEKRFVISGAVPNGAAFLLKELTDSLAKEGIVLNGSYKVDGNNKGIGGNVSDKSVLLYTANSPSLDSISYHFLHKSINLYGEALLRTLAFEKSGVGSAIKGIELLQQFYAGNGIDSYAINIIDGSGLSPQNRVTPKALVKALQLAKTKSWYNSFLSALPEYNGLKMKSGSIGGARAFTGYSKSSSGEEYVFSIIVNNYNGSGSAMVKKLYKLLDNLK